MKFHSSPILSQTEQSYGQYPLDHQYPQTQQHQPYGQSQSQPPVQGQPLAFHHNFLPSHYVRAPMNGQIYGNHEVPIRAPRFPFKVNKLFKFYDKYQFYLYLII